MMQFSLRYSIFYIRHSTVHKSSYDTGCLPCPLCQVWIKIRVSGKGQFVFFHPEQGILGVFSVPELKIETILH